MTERCAHFWRERSIAGRIDNRTLGHCNCGIWACLRHLRFELATGPHGKIPILVLILTFPPADATAHTPRATPGKPPSLLGNLRHGWGRSEVEEMRRNKDERGRCTHWSRGVYNTLSTTYTLSTLLHSSTHFIAKIYLDMTSRKSTFSVLSSTHLQFPHMLKVDTPQSALSTSLHPIDGDSVRGHASGHHYNGLHRLEDYSQ